MGFSIGSFLKSIAGPVIGAIVGGPVGALAGSAITAGFVRPPRPSAPGPTVTRTAFPPAVIAGGAALMGGLGRAMVAGGVVAGILALSRSNTGRPATAKKIREAARVCGIDVAASTFGISTDDVCTIIISRRTRRGRGISAADLRRTRSTIRKITTMQHALQHFVSHQKRGAHGRYT